VLLVLIPVFLICIIFCPKAQASINNTQKRTILALFDSSEDYNRTEDDNLIHRSVEMALNHLGMKVIYHDISKGIPSFKNEKDVHGIISWFLDPVMPNAETYCQWAAAQIQQGKKFIILGNMGAFKDSQTKKKTPKKLIDNFFQQLGLRYEGNYSDNPALLSLLDKDSEMVEFERTLEKEILFYEQVISTDPANKIYLQLHRQDLKQGTSDAVVISPQGGYVMQSYVLFIDYITEHKRWKINPFLFFEKALRIQGNPRYDTTTLLGRRIFYTHIDGDGIRNISKITERFSGEVLLSEILNRYQFPITVSFITSEVDPAYFGTDEIVQLTKDIVKLNHVELGVHAFTHPLDWKKQLTAFEIEGYSEGTTDKKKLNPIYPTAKLIKTSKTEFLKKEIQDATFYLNQSLASENKKVLVQQWTGDCAPPAEGIALSDQLGLRNINGGDSRFDRLVPSYTGIAPLTRQQAGYIQVYASNANENIYTNEWRGPFYGFRHVIETFQQTENPTLIKKKPRRVSPINVYYHFYIAEKKLSLQSLKDVYNFVLTQNTIPIFTSEYVDIVKGFLSGRIQKNKEGGWEFSNYGHCRTVRFDDINQYPDLNRSKGIIGFKRWNEILYIHLQNQNDSSLLYLTDTPTTQPYLESSSSIISDWHLNQEQGNFTTQGFGTGSYVLINMIPNAEYLVKRFHIQKNDYDIEEKFQTDPNGKLIIKISLDSPVKVELYKVN